VADKHLGNADCAAPPDIVCVHDVYDSGGRQDSERSLKCIFIVLEERLEVLPIAAPDNRPKGLLKFLLHFSEILLSYFLKFVVE